jgi:hypothetical protein
MVGLRGIHADEAHPVAGFQDQGIAIRRPDYERFVRLEPAGPGSPTRWLAGRGQAGIPLLASGPTPRKNDHHEEIRSTHLTLHTGA